MRGTALIGAVAFGLAGCAQDASMQPSYLGLSDLALDQPISRAEASEGERADSLNPSVRHVSSNKVLGAMAFQKVTGRSVDPERLSGSQ